MALPKADQLKEGDYWAGPQWHVNDLSFVNRPLVSTSPVGWCRLYSVLCLYQTAGRLNI